PKGTTSSRSFSRARLEASRGTPRSTALTRTSERLTAEMRAPSAWRSTTPAPASRKSAASSAEASRTTLLTPRFFPAFADELVRDTCRGVGKAGKEPLRFPPGLGRGPDVNATVVHFQDQVRALVDAETASHGCWDDDPAGRIDLGSTNQFPVRMVCIPPLA